MAEYNDVIKQFKRMCNNGHCATATGCPMYPSCNIGQCRRIAFERPSDFEKRVMEWAAEHPEPVYPTFGEWLEKQGVVKLVNSDRYEEDGRKVYMLLESVENQIPADVAEKLGIQPKEG